MKLPNFANMFTPTTAVSGAAASGTGTPSPRPAAPARDPNAPSAGLDISNPGADPVNQNLDGLALDGNKPVKESSPLDEFEGIFTLDPKKAPPKDPTKDPLLQLDPAKIQAAVSKLDFTRGIDPAKVQKALQGDVGEFAQVINQAGQAAYLASFNALTGIMERAIGVNNDRLSSTLFTRFKNFQVSTSDSTNPVFKHKAVRPVIASLKDMISSQEPDLSAAEIQSKAENYFLSMHKALGSLDDASDDNADPLKPGNKGAPKDVDWEQFING